MAIEEILKKILEKEDLDEDMKKSIEARLRGGLYVKGVTFDKLEMPDELRKAIIDYYAGRGFPLRLYEKYYLDKSLVIHPEPKQLIGGCY